MTQNSPQSNTHVIRSNPMSVSAKTLRRTWGALFIALLMSCGMATQAIAASAAAEGITVHGDWTVTVRNPDGTIAREINFANALVDTEQLKGILIGSLYPSTYGIEISAAGLDGACSVFGFVDPAGVDGANALSLTTNFTFGNDCIVDASWTLVGVTSSFVTSEVNKTGELTIELGGVNQADFTQKTLDAPITGILPDQVVTIKVVISFS